MSTLQRKVAKSKIDSEMQFHMYSRRPSDPDEPPSWTREQWEEAGTADAAGYVQPEIRFPVVISPNSPVSSPEKLQQLAELESLPETIETVLVDDYKIYKKREEERVVICHVNWEEREKLEQKAEVLAEIRSGVTVMFKGGQKVCYGGEGVEELPQCPKRGLAG